jgi:FdhD protein
MDICRQHPIRRFEGGASSALADTVVNEIRLELDLNDGQGRLAMLCLPRDLEALAVGFLLSEGVLRSAGGLRDLKVDLEGRIAHVRGDFDEGALEALSRRWTWGSGCGGGGTSGDLDQPAFAQASLGPTVTPEALIELTRQFQSHLDLWRQTGGVHACALAEPGRLLLWAEDVGRHNAFDKIVGLAALKGIGLEDKLAFCTGRISAEIVSKAAACRVPILVSRCAVTGLSVDLARRLGMTLVGFLRGERLSVYTGYERVVEGSRPEIRSGGPSDGCIATNTKDAPDAGA